MGLKASVKEHTRSSSLAVDSTADQ